MKTYLVTLERTVTQKAVIEIAAKDKKTALFNAGPLVGDTKWSQSDDVPYKVRSIEQQPEPQLALVAAQAAPLGAPPTAPAEPSPDPAKRKVRSV
jgi:hypothetical protein